MKVIITSKGFTANQRQVSLIESKFQKLGKYFADEIVANVTMSYSKGRQKMEAMISVKGTLFRAEWVDMDMNVCLDKVVDKLASQMSRYKTKLQRKHKNNKEILFEEVPDTINFEEDLKPIKVKSFELLPMDIEEAILQMELLEHSFFVFMNSESNVVNVVYKRADSTYGLLDPKY